LVAGDEGACDLFGYRGGERIRLDLPLSTLAIVPDELVAHSAATYSGSSSWSSWTCASSCNTVASRVSVIQVRGHEDVNLVKLAAEAAEVVRSLGLRADRLLAEHDRASRRLRPEIEPRMLEPAATLRSAA